MSETSTAAPSVVTPCPPGTATTNVSPRSQLEHSVDEFEVGEEGGPDDAGSAEAQSAEPASTALCPSARPAGR
ncbi:hypothetical protein GCM10010310_61300 [Streptomyces violaceolatus]|uniref:Uncharacterized protein n=1 Tax=Streptomyces violaceolatus TaxID=67378 RepID=A0ABN3T942_9ACTN